MEKFLQKIHGSPLRTRFLLYFIVLTTVPVLILGAASLFLIDTSHRRDVSALELQLIGQKIEETEKFFERTLGLLELVVGYDQKSEIDITQQNFFLENLLAQNAAFEEVSFISVLSATSTYGVETAKKNRLPDVPELFNVSLLPKFTETKEGRRYVGEVYYTIEGPSVTMSAPVVNRNGVVVDVLTAEVSLREVQEFIKSGVIGERGGIILADNNGRLIAKRESGIAEGVRVDDVVSIRRALTGKSVDALQPEDRYQSIFYKEPVVAAGKRMESTGWAFVVEWPLSDADAVMNTIRNQVLVTTLASIIAVLLLAPVIASKLTRPINMLKKRAEEIEQGHFEKEVVVTTNDELEELGHAFNRMSKGLKRLEELKGEFVYIAAHELRAPVTAIKGFISLLLEDRAKNGITLEAVEYLDRIDRANEGLVHLVNDLLEVARSDAGKIEISVHPVDISVATDEVVKTLIVLAKKKEITIEYRPVTSYVLADEGKLKEIMTNLISNAIKYTLGSGTIVISQEMVKDMFVTHVRDSGIGIPEAAQKKLFEKFYRVRAKGTEDVTGTGLGLFIVKQLVEKMGGKIWFVSEEGKGSTFSFSLPVHT